MSNYYELLQVPPTATADEVDAACTTLYNKWRRLVTHHAADVRNQATQALEQLEGIRATLSDPVARAAYDAGIGLKGQIGGLADPDAVLAAAPAPAAPVIVPPSTRLSGTAPAATVAARPSLWTCPKKGCRAENPPNTKFCLHCGTQLVRECPACHKMASLVASGFCGECGENYSVVTERSELEAQITERQSRLERLATDLVEVKMKLDLIQSRTSDGFLAAFLALCALLCFIISGIVWATSSSAYITLLIAFFGFIFLLFLLIVKFTPEGKPGDEEILRQQVMEMERKQLAFTAEIEQLQVRYEEITGRRYQVSTLEQQTSDGTQTLTSAAMDVHSLWGP